VSACPWWLEVELPVFDSVPFRCSEEIEDPLYIQILSPIRRGHLPRNYDTQRGLIFCLHQFQVGIPLFQDAVECLPNEPPLIVGRDDYRNFGPILGVDSSLYSQ
jgi:hypothetical protein